MRHDVDSRGALRRSAVVRPPAERETDQAAGQSAGAGRERHGAEGMASHLQRRPRHEDGIRRLQIVDANGALAGILTLDDILESLIAQQSRLVALVAREQRRERLYRV